MFSGFQSNGFQTGFQIKRLSGRATRGYAGDYRLYRKHLEAITRAADERLYGKVKQHVAVIAQAQEENIAYAAREIQVQIDFSKLAQAEATLMHEQLAILLLKLDKLINEAIIEQAEEEFILMLAVS